MKKKFLFPVLLLSFLQTFAADPSEKILNAFRQTFTGAKEVTWIERGQSYEVNFRQNNILTRITYDTEGNIQHMLRYYYEDRLPLLVLSKVKGKFHKQIFGVTEESTPEGGTFYHIVLQDDSHWYNITVDSAGLITLDHKYKKA